MQAIISLLKAIPALLELIKLLQKLGAGTPEDKVLRISTEFRNLSQAKTEQEYANVARSLSNIIHKP